MPDQQDLRLEGIQPPIAAIAQHSDTDVLPDTSGATLASEPVTVADEQVITLTKCDSGASVEKAQREKPCGVWQPPVYPEHPEGDAIRRQVEYYFSDENLPSDAHMLLKTGGAENLPVSVKHICGFSRMRKYKPYRSVVESLKKSTFLNVIDDKYLQRKTPLAVTPTVAPQVEKDGEEKVKKAPVKPVVYPPHLTKGMRKPTGFEEYFTDPPIAPGVFAQEQELYHNDVSFTSRIETAISRYISRRKFHQRTAFIFNAFMKYGGVEGGQKQFGGGIEANDLEDRTAAEIAAITATHKINDDIIMDESKWEVDFESIAKGFLSSQKILSYLRYADQSEIEATTNILRNFYNYILHHNVCPEYSDQIYAARRICNLADKELFDTIHVSTQLPCDFNSAVSRLHGGTFAGIFSEGQTWDGADNFGGSSNDSRDIMMAAISALGTEEQYAKASTSAQFQVMYEEDISFEVTAVELADEDTHAFYEAARETKPHLKDTGKLHCRRWTYPLGKTPRVETQVVPQTFTLFVEDSILEHCFIGLKIEGLIKALDIGIHWLDILNTANPSFFVLLPNEFYDKHKAAQREEAGIYENGSAIAREGKDLALEATTSPESGLTQGD